MKAAYEFEPENRLCVYRISGSVTTDALLDLFGRATSDPDFDTEWDFLTVLKGVSLSMMDTHAIERLMQVMGLHVKNKPKTRRAAIVCDSPMSRGLLVFWATASMGRLNTEERVFDTEQEARLWLSAAGTPSATLSTASQT